MNLKSVGRLIAEQRRAQQLTLRDLAAEAHVGRSTLAALEAGKLDELGFGKVDRICAVLGLVLEIRAPLLDEPIMEHRHLTERSGRELTKAAIEDVIVRGEIAEWRKLVKAMRNDGTGRIALRAKEVANALSQHDEKARAFAKLLPGLLDHSESGNGAAA
jgi:transcriptional regulator with XRE-family HTH domain